MNYIIKWMEWVKITNNQKEFLCILSLSIASFQKEFQTWTIASFLASKMLLENSEKALFVVSLFELGTY